MRTVFRSLCIGILLGATGLSVAHGKEVDGLRISPERWEREVRKVAIWVEAMPYDGPEGGALRSTASDHLADRLRSLGIDVFPAEAFATVWRRVAGDIGGIYSSVDGTADVERRRLAFEYTMRELSTEHEVDAVVTLSFVEDSVLVTRGTGNVDTYALGAVGDQLRWDGFPVYDYFRTWQHPQRVEGLWLRIGALDPQGTGIYGVRCAVNWSRIFMLRAFRERPRSDVFDPEDVARAIDVCTEDMRARETE